MSPGYAFVPLPEQVNLRARPEAVHDRRVKGTLSGTLSLTFVAEQPVHVGSGFKALIEGKVVRRAVLVGGRPGVPGSSMKGVLRARYEAITKSCIQGGIKEYWKVRSRTFGLDKAEARLSETVRKKPVFRAQEQSQDLVLCPACALFGRMSLRSRVSVTDFASVKPDDEIDIASMPKQFAPNLHHVGPFTPNTGEASSSGDRRRERAPAFDVTDLYGRKFAVGPMPQLGSMELVEVLRRDSKLRGELRIHNLLPFELGGILVAVGWNPRSALKVGGGKALGFGRIYLTHIDYHLRDHTGKDVLPDLNGWSDAFERSEDRHAEGVERLVAIHQGDC